MSSNPGVQRTNVYNWQRPPRTAPPWKGPSSIRFNFGPHRKAGTAYADRYIQMMASVLRDSGVSYKDPLWKDFQYWTDTRPFWGDGNWTGTPAQKKAVNAWVRSGVNKYLNRSQRAKFYHLNRTTKPPPPFKPKTRPVTIYMKRPAPPPTQGTKRKRTGVVVTKLRRLRQKTDTGYAGPGMRTRQRRVKKYANKNGGLC